MQTQKFERKPFYVDAVRVTAENIEEVASWCKGEVLEEDGKRYIKVDVHSPLNERQTKAFIGDWVLAATRGHKVYQNKSFWASFVRTAEASPADLKKLAERHAHPEHHNRSAVDGQFVSDEEAKTHPDTTVTETHPDTTVTETVSISPTMHAATAHEELPADAGLGEKSDV